MRNRHHHCVAMRSVLPLLTSTPQRSQNAFVTDAFVFTAMTFKNLHRTGKCARKTVRHPQVCMNGTDGSLAFNLHR